jgi:AbrB family looped-hinge helix DNA binding protein
MTREGSARFVTSRLGVNCQTVLPKEVRSALGVGPGDQVGYSIRNGRVILTPVHAPAGDDPFTCFAEWASEADTEGYASL